MRFTRITVLGTGVLGAQIAFQTAYHGFDVVAWDIDDDAVAAATTRFATLEKAYAADGLDDGAAAVARIRTTADLDDAVGDADLVIEAAPENLELKRSLYGRLVSAAPQRTVFATNSSSLLPSDLKHSTGRPDRFLALHFANHIWRNNTAEVMGTTDTDPEVFAAVVRFAAAIGMVPIELHKEKAGYVLNSMLMPLLGSASALLVDGVADVEAIDATWRIGTGAPAGPFQIMDIVGLSTVYNITAAGGPSQQAFAALVKERYLDRGKTGVASGEGFYRYG